MKRIFTSVVMLTAISTFSQSFINGSFEMTTSTGCDLNNEIFMFNDKMENVVMFSGDQVDIHIPTCYVSTIPEGNKALGISIMDAVTIELTENLVIGSEYTDVMGDLVGTAEPSGAYLWEEHTVNFTAPNSGKFISIRNIGGSPGWNQIDDFKIELISAVSIKEENKVVSIYPNPTNGLVTIAQEGTFNYTLSTLDGKKLLEGTAINQELVSLEDYAKGVYYVTIIADNKRNVYKVIKQ